MENRTIWCDAIQFKVEQDSRKGNYLSVISSKENVTEVNIPKMVTVDGKKLEVKSIDSYVFCNCSDLKSITIPEGVTSIGNDAFYGCASLTSIVIPEGVTSIGDRAFEDCESLTSVAIPDSVTSIGGSAFWGCTSLKSVVIPEGVTSIGDLAFDGCDSLTIYCAAETKPDGWSDSWNLSYRPVVWGHVVYGASDSFLYDISRVNGDTYAVITGYRGSDTDIRIPETINGVKVAVISNLAFCGCESLKSVAIPDSVTSIGVGAFEGCRSLTSVNIGNGVTSIGNDAFYGCASLTSIVIPEGVTSIGDLAFCGCESLKSVAIPDSVTSIGGSAFWDCTSLKSVVIPEGVTSIGVGAFEGCDSLTIYCAAETKPEGWSDGLYDSWNSSYRPVVWGHVVFGASDSFLYGISKVDGDIYAVITGYRGSDTDIRIPETINGVKVAAISGGAFYGCSSLTSVTIPDSVTSIGPDAFYGCSSLTIYCAAESKPAGWWFYKWNSSNRPVVWGYKSKP